MRINYIIVVCIAICTLGWSGCGLREKKPTTVPPVKVKTVRLESRTGIAVRHYVGTVEEEARIPLSMLATGMITDITVHNGQRVRAGEVLLTVDGTQAKNALQSTQATLRQAEDGYKRAQKLHQEGVITDVKEIEIRTQWTEAKSAVAAARKALDDCTITAPRDGVVTDIAVHKGQNIAPGQRAMTLVSEGGYKVCFAVPEKEIADILCGDKGSMDVKAIRQSGIGLTITEKGMTADRICHTYDVKAVVDTVQGLMPGMVCRVELERDVVKGYRIPQQCVQIRPEGPCVWVVEHHAAARRAVKTGGYVGDEVVIVSGLKSGDEVVVEGYQKLYNGCGVQ